MHDHVIFVCKLVGDSFPWGLAWLLALALALLCSQGAKPLLVLQRRECEMESDSHLQELHTSKWVKVAAKSIITMCLFSLYLQGKIGKKLRI